MEKTTKTKKVLKKVIAKKEVKEKTSAISSSEIYSQDGKKAGQIELPENIFGLSWNADLVHQVVYSMLADRRVTYAHTKDRGEVRGGGRKPWKQKGTGRARHGSTRSPIWVGGGVAHGPNNKRNYEKKINKKMKIKALFVILSKKFRDGELLFVDSLKIAKPKTSEAVLILNSLSKIKSDILSKRKNSALIAISAKNSPLEKSFANLGNIMMDEVRNINPVELLNYKYLVIENPAESIKFLENKMK